MMKQLSSHLLIFALLMLINTTVVAEESSPDDSTTPPTQTLAELTAQADLVALAQVAHTDYEYTRDFPSKGVALLDIMIPYRVAAETGSTVTVFEEGLHSGECYFKRGDYFEEGRRHLVFLRRDPENSRQFRGLPHGCALEVFVTEENAYALRYPLSGIRLKGDAADLARPMRFADKYAVVEYNDLSVSERTSLMDQGYLQRLDDGRFRYTHGIELSDIRPLLGTDNLTVDRSLLRSTSGH